MMYTNPDDHNDEVVGAFLAAFADALDPAAR